MPRLPHSDEAEDMIAQAQKLMDSFMEDQFTVPPIRGTGVDGISKREDDGHVYYDVPIEGLKKEDVDVQVGDGQISVAGRIEKENFFSSFHRSFPIPDGVDAERVQIKPLNDKLVIEFPKK
jgi:HSP20 family molecular chaperone IbpA